jgi:hypothetical protein
MLRLASNTPLEWTGSRRVCFDSNSFLPATQGQRYVAETVMI